MAGQKGFRCPVSGGTVTFWAQEGKAKGDNRNYCRECRPGGTGVRRELFTRSAASLCANRCSVRKRGRFSKSFPRRMVGRAVASRWEVWGLESGVLSLESRVWSLNSPTQDSGPETSDLRLVSCEMVIKRVEKRVRIQQADRAVAPAENSLRVATKAFRVGNRGGRGFQFVLG